MGIEVDTVRSLGANKHLYPGSDVDGSVGKHYLANEFMVRGESEEFTINDQNGNVQVFKELSKNLNQYVEKFVQDATAVNR